MVGDAAEEPGADAVGAAAAGAACAAVPHALLAGQDPVQLFEPAGAYLPAAHTSHELDVVHRTQLVPQVPEQAVPYLPVAHGTHTPFESM